MGGIKGLLSVMVAKETLPLMTPSSIKRFWSRIAFRQHGCWEWKAALTTSGYSEFSSKRTRLLGHRVAYEQVNGLVPRGLTLDHLCRNRRCVNPDHLEPVTNRENILRGEGISVANAAKTHCPQGHEYTPANTILRKNKRECRTCANASASRKYYATRVLIGYHESKKTHCPQGHPYSLENTSLRSNGHRRCKACHRNRESQRYHFQHKRSA